MVLGIAANYVWTGKLWASAVGYPKGVRALYWCGLGLALSAMVAGIIFR
jgi:hypothetical protein